MFCPSCGARIDDGGRFCPVCGKDVTAATLGDAAAGATQQGPVQEAWQQGEQVQPGYQQGAAQVGAAQANQWQQGASQQTGYQQSYSQAGYQQGCQPGAAQNYAQGGYQQGPVQPGYRPVTPVQPRGCLSQAFGDIIHIPGALNRVLVVALVPAAVAVVPVVGWVAAFILYFCGAGFAIEWGRDLSRNRGFDLLAKPWRSSMFSLGFLSNCVKCVLGLLAAIPSLLVQIFAAGGIAAFAASLLTRQYSSGYSGYGYSGYGYTSNVLSGVSGVFAVLVVIVQIVCFVFGIFCAMYGDAAVMHLGITGKVESAFSLKNIWKAYKRELGKLFCASVLPGLIVGVVAVVVIAILWVVFGAAVAMSRSTGVLGFGMFVLIALTIFVVLFAMSFANMLAMRAVGYWAARYAPEWQQEPVE